MSLIQYSHKKCKEFLPIHFCLSDCNGIQTHSHLVRKWALNHLAKITTLKRVATLKLVFTHSFSHSKTSMWIKDTFVLSWKFLVLCQASNTLGNFPTFFSLDFPQLFTDVTHLMSWKTGRNFILIKNKILKSPWIGF